MRFPHSENDLGGKSYHACGLYTKELSVSAEFQRQGLRFRAYVCGLTVIHMDSP